MFEFGKALSDLIDKVGWKAVALILIGGGATALSGSLPDANFALAKDVVLPGLALVCFSAGTLVILVKIMGGTLVTRPGQGLIEGAAAGALASIVGGLLGFGLRTIFDDGYVTLDYPPRYIRILTISVAAVPVSAVVGLLLDLLHPKLTKRQDLSSGHYAFFSVLVLLLVIAVIHLNPVYFVEAGATYGDIQIVVVSVFFFLYVFYAVDYLRKPYAATLGAILLSGFSLVAILISKIVAVPHWRFEGETISLFDRMSVTINFPENADALSRALDESVLPETTAVGVFVFLNLLWFVLGYWIALRVTSRVR